MDEAHYVATADYKVSASGRKVHKMKKIADDPTDSDKDAEDKEMTKESAELVEYETKDGVYRHQAKAGRYGGSEKEKHAVDTMSGPKKSDLEKIETDKKKKVKEETELEEAVTVKKQDYSWGKMVTVHHGSDTSYPLHPEHQKKIAGLKHGEKTSFKDETGSTVHAEREDDKVHLSSKNTNKKTTVAHSHFSESVNKSDVPAFLRKKSGDKLTLKDLDKERTQNRSHPETLKKINGTQNESAPVAPVPDRKYIKGTPEYKAHKEKNKPRTGQPTNESIESDRHAKWHSSGAHGLAKEFGEHGNVSTTKKDITVRARTHHASHNDGSPVLKHFDNKERHEVKTVTIPKGSKVVHNKDSGYNYAHHPEHGHVEFDHDDVEKKEGVNYQFDSLFEAVDKQEQRFLMLARLGLVDKADVSKLRIAMDQLKADKPLTVAQRSMLLSVMSDLVSLVTGDDMIFNRVKRDIQTEDYTLVEEEEIVLEGDNKQMKGKDPCWKGYQMVGVKDKNGKKVPNCVPTEEKEVEEGYVSDAQRKAVWAARNDAKKEETDVPFDPDPPRKNPSATPGKHGSGYSTARHLARMALQKQQQKQAQKAQNK